MLYLQGFLAIMINKTKSNAVAYDAVIDFKGDFHEETS